DIWIERADTHDLVDAPTRILGLATAVVAGYADQAHLARETRELAGLTLGAYAALANSETPQPSGSSTTA
ncbi:hypothetical protein AB0R12_35405, partial [Streptomyces niveus]